MLCVPTLLAFTLFHYVPMIGIILPFKRFMPAKGLFGSPTLEIGGFYIFTHQPFHLVLQGVLTPVFIAHAVVILVRIFSLSTSIWQSPRKSKCRQIQFMGQSYMNLMYNSVNQANHLISSYLIQSKRVISSLSFGVPTL